MRGESQGRQRYYRAAVDAPFFPELRGLVAKTSGLAEVLAGTLAPLRDRIRLAFIFGSVATGREGRGSDIDLLVVGRSTLARNQVEYESAELVSETEAQEIAGMARRLRDRVREWLEERHPELV